MTVHEIVETPGGYYGMAYWLSSLLYIILNKPRFSGWKRFGLAAIFLILIFSFLHFNRDVPIFFFIPSMMISWTLMFSFIYISNLIPVLNAAYYTVRAFILAEFAASLEWQLYYYALNANHINDNLLFNVVFLLLIHSAIFVGFYFLEKKFKTETDDLLISRKELLYALLFGLLIFSLSNLSYVYKNTPFSSSSSFDIFNIRTMVDFAGVALLLAYHIQLAENHIKFEVEKLQNLLILQHSNFKIYEDSINMVNQKYHDLKHQIAALKLGINQEKSGQFLDKLEQDILVYEAQNKTGNRILDIVLTAFSIKCQNLSIEMTCVAEGTALDFMDDIEISTLFGNILDNALESVQKVSTPEKKLIHIAVRRQKSFLLIRVENFFSGNLKIKNGLPVTTKKNKTHHGYGLKSIKNITEKYHGSMTLKAEDSWFELRILIPFNNLRSSDNLTR